MIAGECATNEANRRAGRAECPLLTLVFLISSRIIRPRANRPARAAALPKVSQPRRLCALLDEDAAAIESGFDQFGVELQRSFALFGSLGESVLAEIHAHQIVVGLGQARIYAAPTATLARRLSSCLVPAKSARAKMGFA